MSPARRENMELVDPPNFLTAIRDTGYRSPAAALAELVDNAVEAGASLIEVLTSVEPGRPVSIEVRDNGSGMTRAMLGRSLLFGGSSRFGSRKSLGRFGMGLPTASLSLARRVEVETWRGSTIHRAELSIDGASPGRSPLRSRRRTNSDTRSISGTSVRLDDCDRVGYQSRGWLVRHLRSSFATTFRSVLSGSTRLTVDNEDVGPSDHLLLDRGARRFGDDLRYSLAGSGSDGAIVVRFSELPVQRWAHLEDEEKRRLGVLRSDTVSITRGGREVDRGWFFMGDKPRENYDSWWRCEVDFDPALDELFGVTFTKQRIRPTSDLAELLAADLEPIARALNSHVRASFDLLRLEEPRRGFEQAINAALAHLSGGRWSEPISIEFGRLPSERCLEVTPTGASGTGILLNTDHAAFRHLYRPLAEVDSSESRRLAQMSLGVLVAPHVVTLLEDDGIQSTWDDVLTALLGKMR